MPDSKGEFEKDVHKFIAIKIVAKKIIVHPKTDDQQSTFVMYLSMSLSEQSD